MRESGYVEDKTIIIEYRYADARPERLPALAEELVRLKVEIIVADTTLVARAARKVTSTIPIVFLSGSDPTQTWACRQFGSTRRQCHGFDKPRRGVAREAVELMKEVVPKVSRFALLEGTGGSAANKANIAAAQKDAQALGVTLRLVEIKSNNADFDGRSKSWSKSALALS